jgi:hypothetical protein
LFVDEKADSKDRDFNIDCFRDSTLDTESKAVKFNSLSEEIVDVEDEVNFFLNFNVSAILGIYVLAMK